MNKVVVASISYNGALKFKQSLYIIELGILICNSSMMTLVLTLLLKWGRTVCAKCVRLGRSYLGSPTLIKYWNPWFSTTLYGLMSMAINAATPWVKCLCRSLVCESFCFSLNISGIVGAVVFLTILAGVFLEGGEDTGRWSNGKKSTERGENWWWWGIRFQHVIF